MMLTTGISMVGKISVGVRTIASPPKIKMSMDATTNVWGRRNASRTIHIESSLLCQSPTAVGSLTVVLFTLRPIRSNALPQLLAVAHLKSAHDLILVACLPSATGKVVRAQMNETAHRVPGAQDA